MKTKEKKEYLNVVPFHKDGSRGLQVKWILPEYERKAFSYASGISKMRKYKEVRVYFNRKLNSIYLNGTRFINQHFLDYVD